MKKRICALGMAVLMSAALFTGCGGSKDETSMDVVLMAPFLSTEAAARYGEMLRETDEGVPVTIFPMVMGDGTGDAMVQGTNMMKFSAMIAAKEVDVVISDLENAQRNARGEVFVPLSDYLTQEEIAALGDRALDFQMVDDEGNPTEERTTICGVKLQNGEVLKEIFGDQELGVFIIANTDQKDSGAKAVRYAMENPV